MLILVLGWLTLQSPPSCEVLPHTPPPSRSFFPVFHTMYTDKVLPVWWNPVVICVQEHFCRDLILPASKGSLRTVLYLMEPGKGLDGLRDH